MLPVSPGAVALAVPVLVALAAVDLRERRIPNRITYPAAAITLAWATLADRLPDAAAGALWGVSLVAAVRWASRGGVGWGDVKMAGLVGLLTGVPGVLYALGLSVMLVAAVAVGGWLSGRLRPTDHLPFAPMLAVGTVIVLLMGVVLRP